VRGRRAFDHPTWHYINYPIIEAGSALKAADHEPPANEENAVSQLAVCVAKIRAGTDEEKAAYLTWLFHLVGRPRRGRCGHYPREASVTLRAKGAAAAAALAARYRG
jgi:hypothetical protein